MKTTICIIHHIHKGFKNHTYLVIRYKKPKWLRKIVYYMVIRMLMHDLTQLMIFSLPVIITQIGSCCKSMHCYYPICKSVSTYRCKGRQKGLHGAVHTNTLLKVTVWKLCKPLNPWLIWYRHLTLFKVGTQAHTALHNAMQSFQNLMERCILYITGGMSEL